jgi:hypothetical protein
MMSLSAIHDLAQEQARLAAKAKKLPFTVEQEDIDGWRALWQNTKHLRFPFPNLGNYRPRGWELTDSLFCDKLGGWGSDGRSAGIGEILDWLKVNRAYAIIEEGQFQLVLGEFVRSATKIEKSK